MTEKSVVGYQSWEDGPEKSRENSAFEPDCLVRIESLDGVICSLILFKQSDYSLYVCEGQSRVIPRSTNPEFWAPYKRLISVVGDCELRRRSWTDVVVYSWWDIQKDGCWYYIMIWDQILHYLGTPLYIQFMSNYRKKESVWIRHQRWLCRFWMRWHRFVALVRRSRCRPW